MMLKIKDGHQLGGDAYNAYEDALKTDPKWSYYAPARAERERVIQPMYQWRNP
jgi:hypothetical protein